MTETVEIKRPENMPLRVDMPQARKMVRVSGLLLEPELKKFRETGSIAIVDVGGRYYSAALDSLVPETARIVREKEGVIYGLPAVTGG